MTSNTPNESAKSAIYIDTENLGGNSLSVTEKVEVIKLALEQWPGHLPQLARMRAYINPAQQDLWGKALEAFTEQRKGAFSVGIPGLVIETTVIQRYGRYAAKNALDITLVLDVLSDLILGRVGFAAVISNDSDFASLYFKLRDLVNQGHLTPGAEINGIPLLLFTHDLSEVSREIRNLGENVVHVTTSVPESRKRPAIPAPGRPVVPAQPLVPPPDAESLQAKYSNEQLAGAVAIGFGRRHWEMVGRDIYTFTYKDVFGVIKGRWPLSREATPDQHEFFSRWFHENLWPVMERYGASSFNYYGGIMDYRYNLPWAVREELKLLNPQDDN